MSGGSTVERLLFIEDVKGVGGVAKDGVYKNSVKQSYKFKLKLIYQDSWFPLHQLAKAKIGLGHEFLGRMELF